MIDPLNSQFEVNDRGGEYYTKLRTMHTRINQLISEFNALAGDHATAAQGQLAETAYADRFKWDGSPAALANPAAGRASLQLGSSATRPASDFATYHQGSLAEEAHTDRFKWNGSAEGLNAAVGRVSLGLGSAATQSATNFATAAQGLLAQTAIQPGHFSIVGANLAELPTPSDTRYLQFHSGGGVSMLTAVQFLAAIGASSGMANPMTAAGDLIIGGADGVPTKLSVPGTAVSAEMLAVSGGVLGYYPQNSNAFDFGRGMRGRTTTANVSSNPDFNIDLEGGIHVAVGADYWISPAVNQGTHPVWEGFSVANYRLQDFRIAGGTGSSNGTRYQIAIPNIESEAIRDNAYLQIRFKQNGESSSETWGPWQRLGGSSGGGGDSHRYAPMLTLTASMQVSNNISVTLDADQYNFFLVNGWPGADNPNSSGVYNIEIGGLVADPEKIVSGHIHALRLGRKTAVNITADGFIVNWIAVPTFKNTVTGTDLIHYYISPLRPTVLNLSLVDTRT